MPAAPAAAASVNASSPSPPSTYQVRNPPVTAETASSRACGARQGVEDGGRGRVALDGPMVSCGRSGP